MRYGSCGRFGMDFQLLVLHDHFLLLRQSAAFNIPCRSVLQGCMGPVVGMLSSGTLKALRGMSMDGLITGELSAVIMGHRISVGNVASSVKRIDPANHTEKGKTRPTSGGDNIMSLGRVVIQMI